MTKGDGIALDDRVKVGRDCGGIAQVVHHLAAPLVRVEDDDMGWSGMVFLLKLPRHQMAKSSAMSQSPHSIVYGCTFYGFKASSRHISTMFSIHMSSSWYVRSRLPF